MSPACQPGHQRRLRGPVRRRVALGGARPGRTTAEVCVAGARHVCCQRRLRWRLPSWGPVEESRRQGRAPRGRLSARQLCR